MKHTKQRHKKRRQQRALDRLRNQLDSGVEVKLSDKDTKRISKEISILEEKLKYSS